MKRPPALEVHCPVCAAGIGDRCVTGSSMDPAPQKVAHHIRIALGRKKLGLELSRRDKRQIEIWSHDRTTLRSIKP